MSKSIKDWLSEGETIYDAAMGEYQALEAQIIELEQKLAIKREEVNIIADKLGKPPVETSRRFNAEIIDRGQRWDPSEIGDAIRAHYRIRQCAPFPWIDVRTASH